MKKLRWMFVLVVLLALVWGCSDATVKNLSTYGDSAKVILYACDGKIIREWESTGKVATESQSDGWRFVDKATNKLIRVTGTVVVEN